MAYPVVEIVQGDSYEEDYTHDTLQDVSAFTGTWAIVTALGVDTPENTLASGTLVLSDDSSALCLRIGGDRTNSLPVGVKSCYLVVQISSSSVGFIREACNQYHLTVKPQGIFP